MPCFLHVVIGVADAPQHLAARLVELEVVELRYGELVAELIQHHGLHANVVLGKEEFALHQAARLLDVLVRHLLEDGHQSL